MTFFRRRNQETSGQFITRESVVHDEFREAVERLLDRGPDPAAAGDEAPKGSTFLGKKAEQEKDKPDRLTRFLDIVRGWRLLRVTSFDVHERQAVMASAQNKLSCVAVSDALLTQWEDRDLLDRDRKFGKEAKARVPKVPRKAKATPTWR